MKKFHILIFCDKRFILPVGTYKLNKLIKIVLFTQFQKKNKSSTFNSALKKRRIFVLNDD